MPVYGPLLPSVRNREITKLSLNIGRLKALVSKYESMIIDEPKNLNGKDLIQKIEKSLEILQVFPKL